MAHEIENDRFISTQKEWHGKGTQEVVGLTILEAIKRVHPELLVKLPLQAYLDDGSTFPTEDCYGIYRVEEMTAKYIGCVGARFEVDQPVDLMSHFIPLEETGLVEVQTAGVLCEGTKVFITARVKDTVREIIKGDEVNMYFTMATGLCGNMTRQLFNAATRTVCANTLAISQHEGKANNSMVQVKHTKSMHARTSAWVNTIEESLVQWEKTVEAYRSLTSKSIKDSKEVKTYVDNVFEVDRTKEVSTKTENKVRYVCDLFDSGRGTELVPANYWRAYNAVTEYLTHSYGHTDDSRLDSLMFGESKKVNQRALSLAMHA